jgi:hypothetical protein
MSYARSDVMNVTVSRAHGGCGDPHSRPIRNGAPAKIWQLDCPQCRAYLHDDPLWSDTLADLPSTPDEDTARDTAEKHTARSRDDIMALALAKIAGLPVAEFLSGMVGQAADSGTVECAAGHENFPSAKFCAECGERLAADAAVPASESVHALPSAVTTSATESTTRVEWLSDPDLRGSMVDPYAQQPAQPEVLTQPSVDKGAIARPPRAARQATQPKRPAAAKRAPGAVS